MRNLYTFLAVLTASMLAVTGCHVSSNTGSPLSSIVVSLGQQKIDETNMHIRGLSKNFWEALGKWLDFTGKRTDIGNNWLETMKKKYADNRGFCSSSFCLKHEEMYYRYGKAVNDHTDSPSLNSVAVLERLCYDSGKYPDLFEYDPAKVQDKHELFIRVDDFGRKIDKVRFLLNRGMTTRWYDGIPHEWMPVVQDLRFIMAREDDQLALARHDLMAIREWIQGLSV